MTVASTRAAERLDRPGLAPLVDELHRRLGEGTVSRVRVRRLHDEQRTALADLLGASRLPSDPVVLRVETLVAALGLESVDDLRAAVEEIRGPVVDRGGVRETTVRERERLWTWFEQEADARPVAREPRRWVKDLRRSGVRRSVPEHRRWLSEVLRVLDALPAASLTLAELAQDTLDDPHALDRGRSRAAAVLGAIAPVDATKRDAESVRMLWESVGVAPDALSSTVLSIGLRSGPGHPLAPLWSTPGATDEPSVLTLSQLRRWPLPPLAAAEAAYLVENPSLLSAAARAGWQGPPLICSSGRPTVAVVTLVRQLAAGGARILQHADLDPVGLSISAWLAERAGTVPWRMGAVDYLSMVGTARRDGRSQPVPATPWDPALQAEMADRQVWVYEEQVRAELLEAMQQPSRG